MKGIVGFILGLGVAGAGLFGAFAHYGTLSPCAWYVQDVGGLSGFHGNLSEVTGEIVAKAKDWSHGRCAAEWAEHHVNRLNQP